MTDIELRLILVADSETSSRKRAVPRIRSRIARHVVPSSTNDGDDANKEDCVQ